jgi:signal peptidase I
VQVVNRKLLVNGQPAPRPRNMKFNTSRITPAGMADPRIFPRGAEFNEDNWGPVVVPWKGEVIALNPATLQRWQTFIGREGHTAEPGTNGTVLVDGKPVTEYTVERNYLFGMGDNRDNSLDSRFWGFIPEENLVGTPMIVYWSWDPDLPISDIFRKIGSIRLGRVGSLIR